MTEEAQGAQRLPGEAPAGLQQISKAPLRLTCPQSLIHVGGARSGSPTATRERACAMVGGRRR